ncbi:uncharacterized protein Z518_09750 [Rhinocladiella mackenziei CBS 650.93]|uniref:Rhinocladiella mackenziei CBS 650.93 unplaced genomic scaffold supercont1.8, whole genome shotgun sequence n=1 Tax=Rhinocladiella mackenziei CBS 650.93 TaxID=1442369 RepID=A0A0D2IVF2_9EURO|nr:uncharacterized protein Z518_09750 [Rhinocladiella mackenziei CBS 650.93]KIX00685.1 hypothetical protein Z518_09750 [Rhinocladiella mackenziei CBS 650.93]
MSSSISSASSAAQASSFPSSEPAKGTSTTATVLTSVAVVLTVIAVLVGTIWFAGYTDDLAEWWAKRYYKAKALAEAKGLQNAGSEKVERVMKDSLKKNPVMGEDELEQVSGGLGKEAVSEGPGGVDGKLDGLGKL